MKVNFSMILFLVILFSSCHQQFNDYHVAKTGNDANQGTAEAPFLTIQRAAQAAMPGDVITVHEGIYRESVHPPRGGTSEDRRITYQAAAGEAVEIRGSEVVTGWVQQPNDVWITEVHDSVFGDFNPFTDEVRGDWFNPMGRKHHTGCVYINGEWLFEAAAAEDLATFNRKAWFAIAGDSVTRIFATFDGMDPNQHLTEINVRQTVFYPRRPFVNYITLRGFRLRQAAPPWAPPTAEQKGLVGTHWSKGWIIENNVISHSINAGITLGKYGDAYDNLEPTARAYLNSIDRARKNGWNRDSIGSHIIRNNEISYCEQAGMVGSMGASFSQVTGNYIHHIHTQRRFGGAEMAAIKFHAPIDMLVSDNRIHDGFMGIWLDWMTQGTRVTGNLLYRNTTHDIYLEVNHGPFVVDNNICLSDNCRHLSQGGAYVHNLFAGKWGNWANGRSTPYFRPHSTEKLGDHAMDVGDDRFYNNLFIGNGGPSLYITETTNEGVPFYFSYGLQCYEYRPRLPETGGNVYYHGAMPCSGEDAVIIETDPGLELEEEGDTLYLVFSVNPAQENAETELVTTDMLGKAIVPGAPFEDYDGTRLVVNRDYLGMRRAPEHPAPGPFADIEVGMNRIRVWPK